MDGRVGRPTGMLLFYRYLVFDGLGYDVVPFSGVKNVARFVDWVVIL
jgi:hypothetical protein